MDIKELLTILERFDTKDTRKPNESDVDDIREAIQTLNKAEWFVNVEEESKVLHRAQNILQGILDTAKGYYDEALKEAAERYLSVEPGNNEFNDNFSCCLVLMEGDKRVQEIGIDPRIVQDGDDKEIIEIAKDHFDNITDDIRVQWY